MGFIATPFAGNVPNYDLLVANEASDAIPIQVKTINGGNGHAWQFKATSFLHIGIGKKRQIVRGRKPLLHPDLVCVFVLLVSAGKDEFFTFTMKNLQDHFACGPYRYTGRKRPKNIDSMHCAIWPEELQQFKGWDALLGAFKRTDQQRARERKLNSKLVTSAPNATPCPSKK
jgi:hypothetical protein